MKTTITTKSARFALAHAITRATILPGDDYRATFAAALRLTYAEPEAAAVLGDPAAPAADKWALLTGEEQFSALKAATWYGYRRGIAECDLYGNFRINHYKVIDCETSAESRADMAAAIAAEAWIVLQDYFTKYPEETSLGRMLYRATATAAQRIDRAEKRNARALRKGKQHDDETGADREWEYIIDNAAPMAERFSDPFSAAAFRESLDNAARDEIDRAIIGYVAAGYSAREIAPRVGKSHTAINKRLRAIRDRYDSAE